MYIKMEGCVLSEDTALVTIENDLDPFQNVVTPQNSKLV